MSAFLLSPLRRPLHMVLGFSAVAAIGAGYRLNHRPLLLDAPAVTKPHTYSQDARVPIWKNGRINPRAYGQLGSGSLLGLASGVAVSAFSRPLAFLIGLAVLGVQYLSSIGINVIPTKRLQRYVKGIDLRSALEDNLAFKFAFGSTFLLAACAEL